MATSSAVLPQSLRGGLAVFAVSMAAVLSLVPSSAHADLVFTGEAGASHTVAPFYRSFAYSGFDYEPDPSSFAIDNGTIHDSNVAPASGVYVNATETKNGATMQSNAYALYNGFYSGRAYASMTVTNAQTNDGYYTVAGQGNWTTATFYTASAAAQRAVFRFNVTGSSTLPLGEGGSRLDMLVAPHSTGYNWNDLFLTSGTGAQTYTGAGQYEYHANITVGELMDFMFWSAAYVQVNVGQAAQGQNFTMTANYANTYDLVGIDLYDANDQLISEWELVDERTGQIVFNQNGRTDAELFPIGEPPPTGDVPLPATAALLGVGLLALRGQRGRRQAL
ncbi:MAG: hypothetical protein AB7L76_22915 [Burkholderiaceae bacterium]